MLYRLRMMLKPWVDFFNAPIHYILGNHRAAKTVKVPPTGPQAPNPLETDFDSHVHGNGIWKWRHYFSIYHDHFSRFRGRRIRILEIGVYGGGSLDMWRKYFGDECEIIGVDINPECKRYARNGVSIHIGNQSDRDFWRHLHKTVGDFDIIIDDGGHKPRLQRPTFEEILRAIKPGGVYLCEDLLGTKNPFVSYLSGFANQLHDETFNPAQAAVKSVTFYPYVAVVEMLDVPRPPLVAEKRGDRWL